MRNFLFFVLIVSTGCQYSPSQTDEPTGVVRGWLSLEGRADSIHMDHSGAKVELLGTDFSTFTNWRGEYRIDGVPPGNYTLVYSAEGYDTLFISNTSILPPNGYYAERDRLYLTSPITIALDSIAGAPQLTLYGKHLSAITARRDAYFFVGRTRDVSPEWGSYVTTLHYANAGGWDSQTGQGIIFLQSQSLCYPNWPPGTSGFKRGDSAYVVGYPSTGMLLDPASTAWRWVNLGERSNVLGFIVP